MSNRTWLVASDIHGSDELWKSIYQEAKNNPIITSIILCGDLTNNGKRSGLLPGIGETYGEFLIAKEYIKKLAGIKPVYWIPGNHDWDIEELDFDFENVACIDRKYLKIDGKSVYGINQSPCFEAPALAIEWRNMSTDPAVDAKAYDFKHVEVVISHCPPEGVLDNLGSMHIGSPALSEYILTKRPQYVFSGHVHDQGGKIECFAGATIANVAATFGVFDVK